MSNENGQVLISRGEYICVSAAITGTTHVLSGPTKFIPKAHQNVSEKKYTLHKEGVYCCVSNPVERNASGGVVCNEQGEAPLQIGRKELRVGPIELPVYPGESLEKIQNQHVLSASDALQVQAISPYTDSDGIFRKPGDTWLVIGPEKTLHA